MNKKATQQGEYETVRTKKTVAIMHVIPTTFLFLGFVSPYIIIHSNKSTNHMHQSLRFIVRRLNTAQHVSGILLPIIRGL
jgi:hypothetical protein